VGGSLIRVHYKLAAAGGVAAACALAVAGFGPATAAALPAGPVLATPVTSIPHFPAQTSTVEQLRQIVQCGNTMYAVGSFSVIKRQSTTYTRNNIFSFSATAPYAVTSWAPDVNGTVNSITFNGGNCADAYIGGKFTAVGPTTAKNIAELDTTKAPSSRPSGTARPGRSRRSRATRITSWPAGTSPRSTAARRTRSWRA
jgi:hypothetical protein